ncbi:hypothetical protein GGH12_001992 [Coemansia sp. RSA 1822]|nr:hypothetical protein LPJ76_001946 [Coemansia sp. RSA 638]KAJ2543397.1 hypothetical protein GGF49_002100 [Coemansia sp. RSA 1853]KAJ2564445.1 hypothetical protein GGH12_001992 [Coemansia sp. RSA 1822]
MADPTIDTQRKEFWQTLLAMGFDPTTAASGTYSGVVLDAHVFEHGIYHMKAFELILHFLFSHLDSTRFKREFFDSWPIGDARQAREFRSHAFKWLDELRRESVEREDGRWPLDVPVRRSFVDESKGIRLEQVLWTLATYVAHTLLRRGGAWAKHIKHPLIESEAVQGKVVGALESCRARYSRRTRDRQQAQQMWQRTEQELERQISSAEERQQKAHQEFRVCRKRIGSDVPNIDSVPGVDASVAEIEQALDDVASSASQLWEASAGWVESNHGLIGSVEAVMENRANSVRLEGRQHVRLAPPPQLAAQWTQWLAKRHTTPFRAAKVDLQVVARMASSCVNALRQDIASGSNNSLDLEMPKLNLELRETSTQQMHGLDRALAEQSERITKLKRLCAQLTDQHVKVSKQIRASQPRGRIARLMSIVGDAVVHPTHEILASETRAPVMAERVQQLACVWEDLVDDEYPQYVVDTAVRGSVETPGSCGLSGMSFFSDRMSPVMRIPVSDVSPVMRIPVSSDVSPVMPIPLSSDVSPVTRITGGMDALTCAKKRPFSGDDGMPKPKRRDIKENDMLVDEDVPDFLVD